jgi:redox-sensitive bicupin YhaK (pirin superfamily)
VGGSAHPAPPPGRGPGWEARVFLGSLLGDTSPVSTATPLLGAELLLEPGARLELDVDAAYELGVLVDRGDVRVASGAAEDVVIAGPHELAYVPPGCPTLVLSAGEQPARLLLLGGPPFGEAIVMWWNFVGRSHDEVVGFREQWQAQLTVDGTVVGDSQDVHDGRFGVVVGDHLPPIPAPPLPNARLRERR